MLEHRFRESGQVLLPDLQVFRKDRQSELHLRMEDLKPNLRVLLVVLKPDRALDNELLLRIDDLVGRRDLMPRIDDRPPLESLRKRKRIQSGVVLHVTERNNRLMFLGRRSGSAGGSPPLLRGRTTTLRLD